MLAIETFKEAFQQDKEKIWEDFFTFLRFQSIATDPAYDADVSACAGWVTDYLKEIGLDVEQWQTDGPPVIFATDLRAGPDAETLLLYCHYDVQPADPYDAWTSPPFEPTVRDGNVFARGAVDNKGQCFYTMWAIKTVLGHMEKLPFNIKFIVEGEEESGSSGLATLLEAKKEQLKADHLLIVDSGLEEEGRPVVCLGARGMTCLTATLTGSKVDLHSGWMGGIALNPNRALADLLSKLHDAKGSVAIPGFYDEVIDIPPNEKKELSFDADVSKLEQTFGLKAVGMEKGIPAMESASLRPTLEINGIWGGYTGSGFKTVIPAQAHAKISCRLVPHQHPERIARLVQEFLQKNTPDGMELSVEVHAGNGKGFRSSPHSRIAKVMTDAYAQVFQAPCRSVLMGGSIPIAADLAEVSGADIALVGVGLPSDQIHAPDEHFGLDRFELGYLTICHALQLLSQKPE